MPVVVNEDLIARLHQQALAAQRRSYSPYSHFPVGAAIYTDRGRIITGTNVENASFGLTICAERGAIMRLVAEDAGAPLICVVVGPHPNPLTPCGACRQVLLEFNKGMRVIAFGSRGARADFDLGQLLPASFSTDDLNQG